MSDKKWTTTAGPIQTKKVSRAIDAIKSEGQTHDQLSGVIGKTEGWDREHRSSFISIFGGARPETAVVLERIGEKWNWTITRENYLEIIKDLEEGVEELKKSRPVKDERRTPEEDAKRNAELAELDAKRQLEREQKEREEATKANELKKQYGYLETKGNTGKSSWALAASNIRRELDRAFPGQEFSVKSSSYSGGSSIDVKWTDGPTDKEVSAITQKYRTASFDGMTDCENYVGTVWNDIFGGVKYVFDNRTISEARRQEIAATLGVDVADNEIGRVAHEQSFYTRPQATTPPADGQAPSNAGSYTLQEHVHTKKGFTFWLVVLEERVERERFEDLRRSCKAVGGWYSRKWGSTPGGFAFTEKSTAEEWSKKIA